MDAGQIAALFVGNSSFNGTCTYFPMVISSRHNKHSLLGMELPALATYPSELH